LGRKLDWLRLRDYLAHADRGRELMEMVIYAGLPPPMPDLRPLKEAALEPKRGSWVTHGLLTTQTCGASRQQRIQTGWRLAKTFWIKIVSSRCHSLHVGSPSLESCMFCAIIAQFNAGNGAINSAGNLGTGPLSFDGGRLEALAAGGGATWQRS
jgi:hypothetical protein